GSGGAIIVWEDGRSGLASDVYAQRVTAAGVAGPPVGVPAGGELAFRVQAPRPNPCLAGATVAFALPFAQRVTADVLDLAGRRVRSLADGTFAAGPHALAWDAH